MKRHRHKKVEAELDITSFMNLMIILVPVLLMSMVFNHITVLDLQLPIDEAIKDNNQNLELIELEIIISQVGFEVVVGSKIIESIKLTSNGYDYERLSKVLQVVKKKVGRERKSISILSQQDIDYQVLVNVIDTAKSFPAVVAASVVDGVLFPDVSLGDAPEKEDNNEIVSSS